MNTLTIHQALSNYDGVNVVLAGDGHGRSFMGVVVDETRDGAFLFVEIDRVTWLELGRGQVDLQPVMTERASSPAFETSDYAALELASSAAASS